MAAAAAPATAPRRFAVVDIGSNSVRLVVYDKLRRSPLRVFNEKGTCRLGLGLARTRRLSRRGMVRVHENLPRFVAVAPAIGAEPKMPATAAVREAESGGAFVAEVERRRGVPVRAIDGDEEACLAALGVLSGMPTVAAGLGQEEMRGSTNRVSTT